MRTVARFAVIYVSDEEVVFGNALACQLGMFTARGE
jgi:hypothetical protein